MNQVRNVRGFWSLVRDLQLSLEYLAFRIHQAHDQVEWEIAAQGLWAGGRIPACYDNYTLLGTIVAKIIEGMRLLEGLPQTLQPEYVYKGPVYIRPMGRGVGLRGNETGTFLADELNRVFGNGNYNMEITFKVLPLEKTE